MSTFGEPGAHGAGVFGTQGIGVSTPMAAAVAAATCGLASDVHIANGGIFDSGWWSMIVAAGAPVSTFWFEVATSVEGAVPKGQSSPAPVQASTATAYTRPCTAFGNRI